MDALCLEIMNSDWHDYRGTGLDEDRLLKPGWIEQLLKQWGLMVDEPINERDITALQDLRTLMLDIAQACMDQQPLSERDITTINSYFDAAPSRPQLTRNASEGERYQLQHVPFRNDWHRVLSEVAYSFATLLTNHDPSRLKRCHNPDCRWIFYDESANQTRLWCEPPCANLMRVRRFRARHSL